MYQLIETSWQRLFTTLSEENEKGLCEGDEPAFVEFDYDNFIAELTKYVPPGKPALDVYRNILRLTIGSKEERPPFLDYVEGAGRFEKQLMKGITGLLDGGFGLGKLGVGLRVLMTAAECSNPLGWGLLGATLAVQGLNAMQRGGIQVGQACSGDLYGHSEGFVEQCLPDSVKPLYHGAEIATDFVALPRGSGRLATMLGGEENLARYSSPSMRMNLQFFAERPQYGEYRYVGGHHIHAKAGFQGCSEYNPRTGFSISQEFMNRKGWLHQSMTNKQMELFRELSRSGRPNTLEEHTRIAIESLKCAGASESEARELVEMSIENLRMQGVFEPTHIPWERK